MRFQQKNARLVLVLPQTKRYTVLRNTLAHEHESPEPEHFSG